MTSERRENPGAAEGGLTRRELLKAAGGIVVLFGLGGRLEAGSALPETDFGGCLAVSPKGRITVFAPMPDAGRGLRTELAQVAAEELAAPLSSVEVILADTGRVPSAPVSESEVIRRVRQAAAEARQMAVGLAAEEWGAAPSDIVLQDGVLSLPDGSRGPARLGDVLGGRRIVRRAGAAAPLTPEKDWKLIGRPAPSLEGPAYVIGKAAYAADRRPANLAYGKVLRPPCIGARLLAVDASAAAVQPGVLAVVQEDDFVGIVARSPEAAELALRSVHATWDEGSAVAGSRLYEDLKATAELEKVLGDSGRVEAALAGARHGFSAGYRLPYTAYAPIEPRAAVAVPEGGGVTVYASTERPFIHRRAVAAALGLAQQAVRVIVGAMGGVCEGKDAPDVSVQAARLARAVGRPVLLAETREEEMTSNAFRAAALIEVRCGLGSDDRIAAWDCDVYNCGQQGADLPYRFGSQRVRSYRCRSPLPQGPPAEPARAAAAFAREVHLDHVASELGADPVALRLAHLDSDSRLARVIRAAAERYGWQDRRPPTGLGAGFAAASDGQSLAAVIAEVEVDRTTGQVRARRVLAVEDAGLVVNPDIARKRIKGAVVMGLGRALKEVVRYEQGRILSKSFASYPIPTFLEAPPVEVVVLSDSTREPAARTASLWATAPAVANAVFDAVGKRLRELPLSPARVRGSDRT